MKHPKQSVRLTLGSACILAIGLAHPVAAEDRDSAVPRIGAFAERVATPRCDGIGDTLKKYGGRALNAATVLNPVRNVIELARAGGDWDTFLDNQRRNLDESKQLAGDAMKFALTNPISPFSTFHYISQALPDGKVSDFMERVRGKVGEFGSDAVTSSLQQVQDDFVEIANDTWNVVKHIDDPEEFVGSLGKAYQKWNPAGAMSLVVTSDDPEVGLKLMAKNLAKQADFASTYMMKTGVKDQLIGKLKKLKKLHKAGKLKNAGAKQVMRAVGGLDLTRKAAKDVFKDIFEDQVKDKIKEFGKQLIARADRDDKKAVAMLVANALAAVGGSTEPSGKHRLYAETVVRAVPAQWMGDDHKSGAAHDMSNWHPMVEDGSDCISLGDLIRGVRGEFGTLKALCGKTPGAVRRGRGDWWERPIDYAPLWNDSCSGGAHDRSLWIPKCPEGFIATGIVAYGEGSTKPLPNRIACLREDPSILRMTDGASAGLQWVTDDSGSGAKVDVTIYQRNFHGMTLSWGVTGYPGPDNQEIRKSYEVPVARTFWRVERDEEKLEHEFRLAAFEREQAEFEEHMRRLKALEDEERRHLRMMDLCSQERTISKKCIDYADERYRSAQESGVLDQPLLDKMKRPTPQRFRHWSATEKLFEKQCVALVDRCLQSLAFAEEHCRRGKNDGCLRYFYVYSTGQWAHNERLGDAKRKTAFDLLSIGCSRGDGASCSRLGQFFERGWTVDVSLERAHGLSVQGCVFKDPESCLALSTKYQQISNGLVGAPRDADLSEYMTRFGLPGDTSPKLVKWRAAYYARRACEIETRSYFCKTSQAPLRAALVGNYTPRGDGMTISSAEIVARGDGLALVVPGHGEFKGRLSDDGRKISFANGSELTLRYTTDEAVILGSLEFNDGEKLIPAD